MTPRTGVDYFAISGSTSPISESNGKNRKKTLTREEIEESRVLANVEAAAERRAHRIALLKLRTSNALQWADTWQSKAEFWRTFGREEAHRCEQKALRCQDSIQELRTELARLMAEERSAKAAERNGKG